MSSSNKVYDVIVIGAGISGLYAARCLKREDLNVLVLEARNHVGGRALTLRDSRFDYADVGGAYIGPEQTKIIQLADELGIELYHLPKKGKSVLSIEGKKILFSEENFPASYFLTLLDLNNALQTLDRMGKEVPILEPWNAPKAKEWDEMSMEDFLKNLCWTRITYHLLEMAVNTVYFTPSSKVSLLSFLREVASSGGVRSSISDLQSMRVKGGSNTFSEKMAEDLRDNLKLKSPVRTIDQRGEFVQVITHNDECYEAKEIIIAMSPPILKNIEFLPDLTPQHYHYIDYKARTSEFKTVMYYKKAYWLDKGLKGEFISIEGVARYGQADTKHDGSYPAILGFVDGLLWGGLSQEERKRKLADQYADIFGIAEMREPTDYVERNWGDEDGKMYSGICDYSLPPGFLTKHKVLWGKSMDKIHFAGSEASVIMPGYMDGGLRAAEAAVVKVLESIGRSAKHNYATEVEMIPLIPLQFIEKVLPSVPGFFAITGMLIAVSMAWAMSYFLSE